MSPCVIDIPHTPVNRKQIYFIDKSQNFTAKNLINNVYFNINLNNLFVVIINC